MKLQLTESEVGLLIACIENTKIEYNLKQFAGPANCPPGLPKALERLAETVKEQYGKAKND